MSRTSTEALAANTPWEIRDFVAARDLAGLRGLDASIETRRAYAVRSHVDGAGIGVTTLAKTMHKRFALDLDAVPIQQGWVAISGGRTRGFAGASIEPWNKRLAVWHFYVDRTCRRLGAGRLLMAAANAWGKRSGARTAWIETSNLNVPGIHAYAALGFQICGFDSSLYRGTVNEDEFAVFMSMPL